MGRPSVCHRGGSTTASRGTRPRGNSPRLERHYRCRTQRAHRSGILEQVKAVRGEIEIGVSFVTIAELMHGAYRAQTQAQQQGRLEFIERLSNDVPAHPVTLDIARLAGRIEGHLRETKPQGCTTSPEVFSDLLHGTRAFREDSPRDGAGGLEEPAGRSVLEQG